MPWSARSGGPASKVVLACVLFSATGATVSAALGDRSPRSDPGRPAAEIAALLAEGQVVVDAEGRPVRDERGRPARIVGREVVDGDGKPLRTAAGARLVVRETLPSGSRPRSGGDPAGRGGGVRRRAERRRTAGRGQPSPPARVPARVPPGSDGPPVVIAVTALEHDGHNRLYGTYGAVQRAADAEPQLAAIEAHVNATGGIAGRRVEVRPWAWDPAGARQFQDSYAALCERGKAERTLAVVHTGLALEAMGECLQRSGSAYLFGLPAVGTTTFLGEKASTAWAPAGVAADRLVRALVRSVAAAGFFGARERVGVLRASGHVELDREGAALDAALAAAGVRPVADVKIPQIGSAADVPALVAQHQSAVLRFKAARVTRVLSTAEIGLFMRAAQQQDYRPLYALDSDADPALLRASLRPGALEGSLGLGSTPLLDVDPPAEPPRAAARRECDELFRRGGVDVGSRTMYGEYSALLRCDGVLAVRDAIAAAGGDVSPAGIGRGLEALGASRTAAPALATTITRADHDGAIAARLIRFGASTARYEGPSLSLR